MKFPPTQACWMVWERVLTTKADKRFLRSVDTTKEMAECHKMAIERDENHGEVWIEESLLNHALGRSMRTMMGEALL